MDKFGHLYDTYFQAVVSLFLRFGFHKEEAEDLAQETFLRVYEHMDQYRGDAEWAFLKVIAKRIALNTLRDRKAKKRDAQTTSIDDVTGASLEGSKPTAEATLVNREQKARQIARLREALASLPDSLRACVLLQLKGFSYTEIMAALQLSLDAVKSRLLKARKLLKEQFPEEERGLDWLGDPEAEEE